MQQAVSNTNRLLGVIRRTYQYLDRTTFLRLYKGLVRPTLEYGVVVWSPQYQHDIDAVEAVQRRAIRMVPLLRHLDYESKYLHGIFTFLHDMFNHALYEGTRVYSLKLFKDRSKREVRRHFFRERVVNLWNSLRRHSTVRITSRLHVPFSTFQLHTVPLLQHCSRRFSVSFWWYAFWISIIF